MIPATDIKVTASHLRRDACLYVRQSTVLTLPASTAPPASAPATGSRSWSAPWTSRYWPQREPTGTAATWPTSSVM